MSRDPFEITSPLIIVPSVITETSSDTIGFSCGALCGAAAACAPVCATCTGVTVLSAIFFSSCAAAIACCVYSSFVFCGSADAAGVRTSTGSCFVTCSNRPSSFDSSLATSTSSSSVFTTMSSSLSVLSRLSSPGISSFTACEKSSLKSLKNPMFLPPFIIWSSGTVGFDILDNLCIFINR